MWTHAAFSFVKITPPSKESMKYFKKKDSCDSEQSVAFPRKGRVEGKDPNLHNEDELCQGKGLLIIKCTTSTGLLRQQVINITYGLVKADNFSLLKEYVGDLEMTDN